MWNINKQRLIEKGILLALCIISLFPIHLIITEYHLSPQNEVNPEIELNASTMTYEFDWDKRWNYTMDDEGQAIARDGDDNIYIAGNAGVPNPVLIKCKPNGEEIWSVQWNTDLNKPYCNSIAVTSDAVYIAGWGENLIGVINNMVFLVKYDHNHNLLWEKTWGYKNIDNFCHDLTADMNGDVYFTGYIKDGSISGSANISIVKYYSDGTQAWNATWNGFGNLTDSGKALALDENRNVYVTGYTTESNYKIITLKYNTSGFLQWERYWNGTYMSRAEDICIDSNNLYLSGFTNYTSGNFPGGEGVLIKYNTSGSYKWNTTWGDFSINDFLGPIYVLDDVLFCGGYNYPDGQENYLIEFELNGNLRGYEMIEKVGTESYHEIVGSSNDELYIVGEVEENGDNDIFLKNFQPITEDEEPNDKDGPDDSISGYPRFMMIIIIFSTLLIVYKVRTKKN
ncbi:MAG: SBBP repeat-containing protein [Promethearchaeia archaeon]